MPVRVLRGLATEPGPRDWGLTALLLVPSLAQVVLDPIAPRAIGVVVALGCVLPVAWRRVRPAAAAVVGTAFWLVPTDGYLILGFVVALVLFFSVGVHLRSAATTLVVSAWAASAGVYAVLSSDQPRQTAFVVLLAVAAPVVAGRTVAQWQHQAARLADLAARLELERTKAQELSVERERARIARELHDVVGHDVTVIALQAEAAAAALARDPERAGAPIDAIRETASRTLHEMRRVVGGLRSSEGLRPTPGPDDIQRLVEDARALGHQVTLRVEGTPVREPTSIGLAVFRLVQESLTNARRHAPAAPVAVELGWGEDAVDLRVEQPHTDASPPRPGGLGLVGMAERARLLDGSFRAGPDGHGLFVVEAHLPYVQDPGRT